VGADRYRIGDLELDVDSATLSRDGDRLWLPPRTFELFLELVRAHPGLLRRRELLERVWPDEHVTDQTLSQRVLLPAARARRRRTAAGLRHRGKGVRVPAARASGAPVVRRRACARGSGQG